MMANVSVEFIVSPSPTCLSVCGQPCLYLQKKEKLTFNTPIYLFGKFTKL